MPNDQAEASDGALLSVLRARIHREGPIPVDRYMLTCMQHETHGYWRRANVIGGDFITAPEISQIFGELIGVWCAVTWRSMESPASLRLVELGPGRGALMRDALRAASKVSQFASAATVHLVELSPSLRAQQREALAGCGYSVSWHGNVREVPPGPAIVVGNEFLDALPIRQFVYEGGWRERVVALGPNGELAFALGDEVTLAGAHPAAVGAIVEMRPSEEELLASLASRKEPIASLFIDYGPTELALGETLQAVHRHKYTDPLLSPGYADLTAHVQFLTLASKARDAGFAVDGPLTQAEFLGRLGLAERTARLMAANPERAGEIEAGAHRLMSPTGMGTLFKAIAVRSPGLPPLVPFI